MLILKHFPHAAYEKMWQLMQEFTDMRDEHTPDELWIVEHEPVYTLGQNGQMEHILNPGHIPVIKTDRGGQVTYHGPGQLVVYTLIDIKRRGWGVRQLVSALENSVIDMLKDFQVTAEPRCDAPGVYVNGAKICSIGLRIRRGCSYHGLAFNIAMDLSPFAGINPCGYQGLQMTQLQDFGIKMTPFEAAPHLIEKLEARLTISFGNHR